MALLINNDCISCDACIDECPTDAIQENYPVYIIEPERCTECIGVYGEPQCISVCPVDCITTDSNNIESAAELNLKYDRI